MAKWMTWYKQQTGYKKWILIILLNWLYWGLVYGITRLIYNNHEKHPIAAFLFQTTFMAIFWTLIFDAWLSPMIMKKIGDKRETDKK